MDGDLMDIETGLSFLGISGCLNLEEVEPFNPALFPHQEEDAAKNDAKNDDAKNDDDVPEETASSPGNADWQPESAKKPVPKKKGRKPRRMWRPEGSADCVEEIRQNYPMLNSPIFVGTNCQLFMCKVRAKMNCMYVLRWDSVTKELSASSEHCHGPLVKGGKKAKGKKRQQHRANNYKKNMRDQQQQQNAIAPFYIDLKGEKWRFLTKLAAPINDAELRQFCREFNCTRRLDARKFNNKRANFYCKRHPKCKFRCTMSIEDGIVYGRFKHNHGLRRPKMPIENTKKVASLKGMEVGGSQQSAIAINPAHGGDQQSGDKVYVDPRGRKWRFLLKPQEQEGMAMEGANLKGQQHEQNMPIMHLEEDNQRRRQQHGNPVHAKDGGNQQQEQNANNEIYTDPKGNEWHFFTKLTGPINDEQLKQFCTEFHCYLKQPNKEYNYQRVRFYCTRSVTCKFRCTVSVHDGIVYSQFGHNHALSTQTAENMPKMHLEEDNRQKGSKPVHAEDGGDQQQQQNAFNAIYTDRTGNKWHFLTKLAAPLIEEELQQFCREFHCNLKCLNKKYNHDRVRFYCKRQPKCLFRCTASIHDGIVYSQFGHNHALPTTAIAENENAAKKAESGQNGEKTGGREAPAGEKENSETNLEENGKNFALANLEQEVRKLAEELSVKFIEKEECFVLANVVNGQVGKLLVMTDEPGRVVLCQYQAAEFTGKWEEVAKNGAEANKEALFEQLRIRCQSYFN